MMREWWMGLNSREKILLISGAVSIFVFLFYLLIWSPLSSHVERLQQDVSNERDLLTWMQEVVPELKNLPAANNDSTDTITTSSLMTTADQSLQEENLKQFVSQFDQTEQDQVTVNFQSVPFDELMSWLTKIWQKFQIRTDRINVTPLATQGLVKAEVVLST